MNQIVQCHPISDKNTDSQKEIKGSTLRDLGFPSDLPEKPLTSQIPFMGSLVTSQLPWPGSLASLVKSREASASSPMPSTTCQQFLPQLPSSSMANLPPIQPLIVQPYGWRLPPQIPILPSQIPLRGRPRLDPNRPR